MSANSRYVVKTRSITQLLKNHKIEGTDGVERWDKASTVTPEAINCLNHILNAAQQAADSRETLFQRTESCESD